MKKIKYLGAEWVLKSKSPYIDVFDQGGITICRINKNDEYEEVFISGQPSFLLNEMEA